MKIAKKHLQWHFTSHKTSTAIKHFLALCRCCTAFPFSTLAQFLFGTALTKPLPLHILTSTAISLSLFVSLSLPPWGVLCQVSSWLPKCFTTSKVDLVFRPTKTTVHTPLPLLYLAPSITILLYEARGSDIKLYFMCKLFKFVRKFCKIGTLGDERCI